MAAATAAGLLARADLDKLLAALRADGRRVIGQTIRDGAVVHDDLGEVAALPVGRRATQAPGTYRLEVAGDGVFDYGPAAASWKPYVYPARLAQSEAVRGPDGELTFSALPVEAPPVALLGIRPCELAGLDVLTTAVSKGPVPDLDTQRRNAAKLTVVAECRVPGGTCFCSAMGTGPGAEAGFDLALTELSDGFLVRVGSDAGAAIAAALPLSPATDEAFAERSTALSAARAAMGSPGFTTTGLALSVKDAATSPR
jgi:sulfhydrogenase subunit beta (sulfur reductase)